jgi:hypothetical protein
MEGCAFVCLLLEYRPRHGRYWHETDMPKYLGDVRCWVNSGKHLLSLSFFGFDLIGSVAVRC